VFSDDQAIHVLQESVIDVRHVDNKHVRSSQIAKLQHIRATRDKAKASVDNRDL
jgi:methylmalonyl-CoA mutase N-terminal domain/subunit